MSYNSCLKEREEQSQGDAKKDAVKRKYREPLERRKEEGDAVIRLSTWTKNTSKKNENNRTTTQTEEEDVLVLPFQLLLLLYIIQPDEYEVNPMIPFNERKDVDVGVGVGGE